MTRGSCLCATVRWGVDAPFERMTHCHCSMCRKAHGAAFATYAVCATSAFRWLAGEEVIARYASSPGFERAFCSRCGSVVPMGDAEKIDVPAGCLDDDPGIRPSAHIFVASKAPWHVIADDLPQHDVWDAQGAGPVIERPSPGPASAGVLRGSCLCAAIAYEVTEPLRVVHNCHCGRCRKARAAAHTTNGFTSADGVRFVRGEEQIATFKPPGAKSFTHAFCRGCGSGVPRVNRERGVASIPMGSLDDDPGRGADDHIYVAYAAPWYTIADELPRYEEAPPG